MKRRSVGVAIAVGAATLVAMGLWWSGPTGADARLGADGAATPSEVQPPPARVPARASGPGFSAPALAGPRPGSAGVDDGEAARAQQRELWQRRLERARGTLEQYRQATRYPPESRPAVEHPDQMEPSSPERRVPFEEPPGQDEDAAVFVVLRQDRVFLAGDEAVTLLVRCEDRRGAPQRCEVPPGSAHEAPHRAGAAVLAPVPVPFADDGQGNFTAQFAPAREGFLTTSGTIRIDVEARVAGIGRRAFFDVLYTGSPPARFTGNVAEKVERGSLHFDVGLDVKRAGRYVITGRVDDAQGKAFAWVQFNEELAPGPQLARLTVFGKLLHDEQPSFPLRLRDLEGFRLLEQGDPDRELLPMRAGVFHASRRYALAAFSPEEWQSEERQRYLDELERDVHRAEEGLRDVPR